MAKLSRSQIKEVREQAKQARIKELEALQAENKEEYEAKLNKRTEKKDRRGFTKQERFDMLERQASINEQKKTTKVTWNYVEGELVYIPGGEIGMIISNNAVNIEVNDYTADMKDNLLASKNSGKVYVVTSSGNNWYYPKTLKPVR